MLTLAIDTASLACQAAICDGERLLGACRETIGRGHAERIIPVIDEALDEAGLAIGAMKRIAVTVGPGSFTGIRVGVSAARGFALALGCDCVGISTLEVLAAMARPTYPNRAILATVDARRGEVYVGLFGPDGEALGDPVALSPEQAAAMARESGAVLAGSGAALLSPFIDAGDIAMDADTIDVAMMARMAATLAGPFERPKPLYLRGADAKPQVGFAVARKA